MNAAARSRPSFPASEHDAVERKGSYVRRAPRYAFCNKSEDIKRLFCRKDSVARLDEFVGPKR